jgi:hypothetical protein
MSTFYTRGLLVCLLSVGLASTQMAMAAPAQQGEGSKSDVAVPAGAPLSESEITILLQAKVPLELIQKFVTIRGVNFVSTKDSSKRIMSAGGDVSLIGTVNLNQKEDVAVGLGSLAANGNKKKEKGK